MSKKFILFIIFLLTIETAIAQEKIYAQIDSLIAAPNYDEALAQISKSISSTPASEVDLILNKKAEVLILAGKLDEAELLLGQIKSGNDLFRDGITATNKGFLALNKARNDLALENLKYALRVFEQAGKSNSKQAALCLSHLSFVYLSIGKLNQALENGLLALQIRQQLYGEQSGVVAASYNDLGVVYSQIDADKALDFYDKALVVYEKLYTKDHPKIAIANINLGIIYQQLKLYGDAVNSFETAEKIWNSIYPNGHPNQALALFNLGKTYNQMGDKNAAIAFFDKSIKLYKRTLGEKHPSLSSVYNQLGLVYLDRNEFDKALNCAQAALCSNIPSFDKMDIQSNPSMNDFYNGKVFLYSLQLKAEALEARHFGKSLKFSDLKLALNCLFKADSLLDVIRHSSDDENDKIDLGSIATDLYENGVSLSITMSQLAVESKKYREIAFHFAEKSKSAVLQESIADSEAKSFAGIPETLLENEVVLKSSLALINQKLSQKPTQEEERILRQQLFTLNQQYETFTRNLENDYPEYFKLKYENKNSTVKEIQNRLDNQTALVSYFIAEKRKKIFRFMVTSYSYTIKVTSIPDNFHRLVSGFSNSLLFNEATIHQATAPALSKVLLGEIPSKVNNLVIIPTGKLSTLPFEALLYKKPLNRSIEQNPFLIKKYAISYEFSAGLFIQKNKSLEAGKTPSIFLCAPVQFSYDSGLDDLPGTEQEVNAIAGLFKKDEVSLATYEEASEERVKNKQMKTYTYLHFATHGIVDEVSPELSRIFLGTGKNEDGNLFSGEIYNLSLPAELAVLSACQTGLGKVSKGEGVIGLSRALTYSGVKNMVVSFWRVNDQSTSQLMTDFYKNLLSKQSDHFKSALREAKLAMINNKIYASPFYWAPFVLIGQ
jgi:CHAT domain-containing protein